MLLLLLEENAMREILITQEKSVLVSDEDFDRVAQFKWCYSASTGYAVRKGRKNLNEPRTVHMHRFIMQGEKGVQIDHINGDKLDNKRSNLRVASIQKNSFNRKKPNVRSTSRYKGVLKRKNSNSWEARIKYNSKSIYLGSFITEVDAAIAYNIAAHHYFGEYAKPNEIEAEVI